VALRVLVVEDEPFLALEIEHIITAEGHEVVGLACDSAGAAALARTAPDLALVDLRLIDGCTGPDIARALTSRGTTILLVTGEANEAPPDLGGAVGLVHKPFTRKQLIQGQRYAAALVRGEADTEPPRFGFQLARANKRRELAD
jgi:DNA-binding response OmpR family regulator